MRKFDLKGSTVDRLVMNTPEKLNSLDRVKATLKDIDFLEHDEK